VLISISYLPPSWYIRKIIAADSPAIESHEHFVKQSIRNRCHILSPNGVQALIVPVVHQNRYEIPIKDLRISYDIPWQRQHWRSLCAAYQRSAFFEFYQDDLIHFYEHKFDFLFDYNVQLIHFLLEQIKIKVAIGFTTFYQEPGDKTIYDFRNRCDSGSPGETSNETSYPQVFSYKGDFVKELSFVDLLFNMGPVSVQYVQPE